VKRLYAWVDFDPMYGQAVRRKELWAKVGDGMRG
jgi:hypothetical protein